MTAAPTGSLASLQSAFGDGVELCIKHRLGSFSKRIQETDSTRSESACEQGSCTDQDST
jgi:hypothetical protein